MLIPGWVRSCGEIVLFILGSLAVLVLAGAWVVVIGILLYGDPSDVDQINWAGAGLNLVLLTLLIRTGRKYIKSKWKR